MAVVLLVALFIPALAFGQQQNVIAEIQPHGQRRIPAETIRARMFTRAGDVFDPASLERDFNSLWNTGYFDDIRFEREDTTKGVVLHVYVREKPTIREIKYVGLNSVSQSEVLDRFKERKVSLTQESQYDPTRVKRAEVTLKELLSERGRQFAEIRTEIRPIPPAAVGVTFVVKEGPKVKVGAIKFEGNRKLGARYLRNAMKNSKPIGIPKSIVLESIFARTFDATKLSEDAERVRDAYQQKGYFKALVSDPNTQIRDINRTIYFWPFQKKRGKVVDITVPIEEGERYTLKAITFTGNKALSNSAALRNLFPMKDGEIFNTTHVRKGLENLRKAYTEFGYINFTPVPDTEIDDEKRQITLKIDIDEGKPFYVRRIEFTGNTTTRDKVIRRELAVEEGQVYNSRLWELSVLRLNQLQYFEQLKPEQDSEIRQNNQDGTVDITLKVKEKGKNSIGLTGGVSGLAGSFIGINYETNNFLGLGETLRVEANVGSRERNILFGFTEPYLFDRPLQFGFTVYSRKYNYNEIRENEIFFGRDLGEVPESVRQSAQNYSQSSTGFTLSTSYALRRSFKRVGLTYGYERSSLTTFSEASRQIFEFINFRSGLSGPNALQGIVTSKVIPSFSFNTIDNPMRPHSGHSFYLAADISGLGGNVKAIRPIAEYKHWIPMKILRPAQEGKQALGFRLQGSFITGWGGIVAPPFERFYSGGDTDIRGFDIRTITPYAFITNRVNLPLTTPDGQTVPLDPANPRRGAYTIPLAVPQIVWTGGDTNVVGNVEYRIPIAGPVAIAAFMDIGMNMAVRTSQLRLSDVQVQELRGINFGCPRLGVNLACVGGTPIDVTAELTPIRGTNYVPRMSTGLELQVIMPVINAPVRFYWAYNPLRLDTFTSSPVPITRDMFPDTAAGEFTYKQALAAYGSSYLLREPRKTFRFTVATTF